MLNAQQLKDRINSQPFKPFRLCLSDGKTFDITNHAAAFVKRNAIEIGLDADPNGLAERFVECAIIHITRIEDLVAA
jgi:hypothetical protein